MRMFPIIAVTMPINDDQRCSWVPPSSTKNILLRPRVGEIEEAGEGLRLGIVAASTAEADRYMAIWRL